MSALLFVAWAGALVGEEIVPTKLPGVVPWLGLADLAFDADVQRELKIDQDGKARLALLKEHVVAVRERLRPLLVGDALKLVGPLPAAVADDFEIEKVSVYAAQLREALGTEAFGKLGGLYTAVRGPALAIDTHAEGTPARAEAVERMLETNRATVERLHINPRFPPNTPEARKAFRADMAAECTADERRIMERWQLRKWPEALVDRLAGLKPTYGPFQLWANPVDFSSDESWLPSLLAAESTLRAIGATDAERKEIARLWDHCLAAERWYYQALCLFPPDEHEKLLTLLRERFRATMLADLQKPMLAALAPERAEMAWAVFARNRTFGNVFNGSLEGELGMSKDQLGKLMQARKGEGFDPDLLGRGKTNEEARADRKSKEQSHWEFLRKHGPPSRARVWERLEKEIMTETQRTRWRNWMKLPLAAPAALAGLRPLRWQPERRIDIDQGPAVKWDAPQP